MKVAYTNPLLPPFNFFHSKAIKGGGAWAPVPLSYASASGAAGICQPRVKARERSDRVGGGCMFPLPTVGNFFVENSCMKTAFFCVHIIMPLLGGRLCDAA